MVSREDFSDPSPSQKRRRGVILSAQGWQRLQAAEYLSAARDNAGSLYTLEQLSTRTGLSTKTLTKVRHREKPADLPTLKLYFKTFGLSLDAEDYIEEFWHPMFGSSYSCNDYFESYLLPASDHPLLLVLDEVNILFRYPKIATDFFGMLRAWYERSRHSTMVLIQ